MKILHVIDSLGAGGKERRLIELLRAIRADKSIAGHLVVLSSTCHFEGVTDLGIPITFITRRSRMDISVFHKLYQVCRQYRPDIIHSWESMCSIYAAPVARILRIKFINAMITTGRIEKGGKKWMRSKLTFPFSDMIFANSHAGLETYKAPLHKSVCIHNGFDFNRLDNLLPVNRLRDRYGIKAAQVVGMVAAIDHRKDIDCFIRAAHQLLPLRENTCFISVGGGALLPHYRQLVDKGPASDRIHFVGPQTRVESIINLFDIGVLLTRSGVAEGVSNAIMEYMALGKPVIATSGGGTPEIVVDGQTGFLIPAGNHELLLNRITQLLDDPELAHRMGEAGSIRIRKLFNLDIMAKKTIAYYQMCLNANGLGKRTLMFKTPTPPV